MSHIVFVLLSMWCDVKSSYIGYQYITQIEAALHLLHCKSYTVSWLQPYRVWFWPQLQHPGMCLRKKQNSLKVKIFC